MALEPGTRVGPYEVVAPFPSGSEERYKATDTRANRVVTLTVLPPAVGEHPELKARLERDARTISSLNHPNLCSLVDIGHQDPATDFIVAEYVEGETLAERLTRGPLEVQEALIVAIAMADALEIAHRKGVVHGGLNPSVVTLTSGGPKLLDFGLASLQGDAAFISSASMATTRTSLSALAAVPSRTAPYTAPERFAGGERDVRADIFAFGAILYEMVTGRPAFHEKTLALLVATLQTVDPEPLSKAQPMAPPGLDYLVRRCLHKDPRQRLQTSLDLATELRWLAGVTIPAGITIPIAAAQQRREWAVWAAVAAVSLLALALVPSVVSSFATAPEPAAVRFAAPTLPTGVATPLNLSPDGRWLVASPGGLGASGAIGLSLDSVTSQILAREYSLTQPFWSPDSRSLAFFEESKLKRVDIGGGPAQIICDAPPPYSVGTWNGDGIILFPGAGLIQRVLAAGGQPTPITALDQSKQETEHVAPFFLPDGRHFLFLAVSSKPGESAVYVGSLDSTERTRLFAADSRTVYAPPGYLLFNRADTVFAQSFDADTLTLSGEPIRVASGVTSLLPGLGTSPSHARWAAFTISQTGVLAYRTGAGGGATGPGEQRSLVWIDRSGQRSAPVGPPGLYAGVDLSPDGTRFVVHRREGAGGDNWLFDVAEGRMQKLTFDGTQDNQSPIWSPDGTRIAFASLRNEKWGLYVKAADGAASEELITESDAQKAPSSWSPDGNVLVYQQGLLGATEIWAVPVAGDKKPFPVVQGKYVTGFPQVSSDGKWLAYASNETNRFELYVKPFPKGDGKWQVSIDGGNFPRWRGDGKELYFFQNGNMFAVDIRVTGSSLRPGVPRSIFSLLQPSAGQNLSQYYNRFAVTADGQRFLVSQPTAGGPGAAGGLANAIIANVDRGGATPTTGPNTVSVVLNWPQLLKQK